VNALKDPVLVEHANGLACLAQLYAAIDRLDDFKDLAARWPMPGEIECSAEDVADGVRRFHESVRRASRTDAASNREALNRTREELAAQA
jgi:hypothetical protein